MNLPCLWGWISPRLLSLGLALRSLNIGCAIKSLMICLGSSHPRGIINFVRILWSQALQRGRWLSQDLHLFTILLDRLLVSSRFGLLDNQKLVHSLLPLLELLFMAAAPLLASWLRKLKSGCGCAVGELGWSCCWLVGNCGICVVGLTCWLGLCCWIVSYLAAFLVLENAVWTWGKLLIYWSLLGLFFLLSEVRNV